MCLKSYFFSFTIKYVPCIFYIVVSSCCVCELPTACLMSDLLLIDDRITVEVRLVGDISTITFLMDDIQHACINTIYSMAQITALVRSPKPHQATTFL